MSSRQEEAEGAEADALDAPFYLAKVASVTYNVGVTSDTYHPGGSGCPTGSTHVGILMDDEDSNNATTQSGYTGGWFETSTHNTDINWCKLNETESLKFMSLGNSSTVGFMVLKLGTNCPNGGYTIKRYFDNEDTAPIENSSTGSISPNIVDDNTHMYFCYYPPYLFDNSMSPTRTSMPSITGFDKYGVVSKNAGSYFGWHYSDDEDSNNANYLTIPAAVIGQARTQVTEMIEAGRNTKVHFARIPN
jgi:hypothetical protein